MIKFKGRTERGLEIVEVVDYSRERQGSREFTFRQIEPDEPIQWYFDKIMNKYWWITGKNKRRYDKDE